MDKETNDALEGREDQPRQSSSAPADDKNQLAYCVTDIPPWYLCIVLSVQHYLTAFGAIFSIPLILSESLCLQHDGLTQSRLINTIFLVSGICTMMQVAFGVRLPILQGGTFALLTPAMAMLSMPEWECPAWTNNASLVDTSSPVFIEVWQSRLRALQGSIMVASLLQIVAGFTGIIGFLMPLHWAFDHRPHRHAHWPVSPIAGSHWGISAMDPALIILFSPVPSPGPYSCPSV
uniref:Uncharacterized protein n=1 Tax=Tetraodon nigroviridis TaxID=99883 RepID=H3BXF8_TETNG